MATPSDPDFSAAWDRKTLLETPTYIASSQFISHVQWLKAGNQNDLVIAKTPDDPKDVAHDQATCAVIGTVSRNRLFLEPHGNYNPNFEKTALETSKAQFQIIAPTDYPQLNADFDQGTEHLQTLQRSIIKEGPDPEHFVVMDGLRPALKFSWPLFEKRETLYDPTDEEDWTNGYPIAAKYKEIMDDIAPRWRATPLPAFHPNKKFVNIEEQEVSLRGALVLVHFKLRHYPIRNKRTNGVAGNTFSATATQVKILERPVKNRSSPYKSLLLKGPTSLPTAKSSQKQKDQERAANTFHPAVTDKTQASTSTAEGKKRALYDIVDPDGRDPAHIQKNPDEDDDATATETESPTAEKTAKKRKTIHK